MNARLALLGTVDPGVTESEVFRLALQHAVGELGALGGAIHLRGPMSALRLVSSTGLPPALTRPWEIIDQEGPTAPARALHQGSGVWVPVSAAPTDQDLAWPGTGLAAVPVSGGDRSIGALTVLMGEQGEPTPRQWDFLRDLVAWTEERMSQAPPPTGPSQSEPGGDRDRLRQALKEVSVGSWDWNIRTGDLIWDEEALELYGTRPEDYTGKIENWMRIVHPDDLAPTLDAAGRAIRDHGVYEAEYRVRRLDGTYGWTQARGRATYDEHGEPHRMIGVGWESNESRSARDALSRALRHMSDGFLAVDEEWRITFANLEAERTLGLSEEELFGRLLWELPAVLNVPGLEDRCRRAAAEETPVGFDAQLGGTGRRHHLRLVPGPDGVTLYLTDVTEKRQHEEERRASELAVARRAVRMGELTAALAKATTSQDVVAAVARRVLPPFAAAGLLVQAVEGDRLHTVGADGYPDEFLATVDGRVRTPGEPGWDVIASGVPMFLSSTEEYAAHYPELAARPERAGKEAWAFLPLTASGKTFGVCVVAFDRAHAAHRRGTHPADHDQRPRRPGPGTSPALRRRAHPVPRTPAQSAPRALPDLPHVHRGRPLPSRGPGHGRGRRLVRHHPALRRPGRPGGGRCHGPRPPGGGDDGPACAPRCTPSPTWNCRPTRS